MNKDLEIPDYVIYALEEVRMGGKHNMHFASDVFRELFNMKHYEAVRWLGKYKEQISYNEFGEEEVKSFIVVDISKYSPAVFELGQIRSLANYLSKI
ncbi:hypothetical protein D3C76_191430 [compost metagenome]